MEYSEFDLYYFKATEQVTRLGRSLFLPFWFRCSFLRDSSSCFIFVLLLFPSFSLFASEEIELSSDQTIASAGYYQLRWSLKPEGSDTIYILNELSESKTATKQIYKGSDTATMISGKPDGIYTYIVHAEDKKFTSKPVTVTVVHHSLNTAFNFFWVGAVVFIFILIAILRGNRQRANG